MCPVNTTIMFKLSALELVLVIQTQCWTRTAHLFSVCADISGYAVRTVVSFVYSLTSIKAVIKSAAPALSKSVWNLTHLMDSCLHQSQIYLCLLSWRNRGLRWKQVHQQFLQTLRGTKVKQMKQLLLQSYRFTDFPCHWVFLSIHLTLK